MVWFRAVFKWLQSFAAGDAASALHTETIHKGTLATGGLASTSCPASVPGQSIFYFISE